LKNRFEIFPADVAERNEIVAEAAASNFLLTQHPVKLLRVNNALFDKKFADCHKFILG
jgi:hypothetical protein